MKSKIVLFSVLAVLALFAVSAVPSASASELDNEVYFVPEDSYGLYCEDISVLIKVDAVDLTTSAGMDIYFDPNCVNITNVDFTGTPYSLLTDWTHGGNYVRIGVMAKDPIEPGTHLIANLTLHCENEAAECTSNLAFDETELLDHDSDPLPNVIWYDGTFSCRVPCIPGIEVNKTVWDKESKAWVDETTAQISENVGFRCEIHNDGTCPLTSIVARDILSDSLEYADNATVNGEPREPEMDGPNRFKWEFPLLVLVPCQTITIEFDAHVVKCGVDVNTQTVDAICEETGDKVFDDDTATVVVPPKPGIEVNKTVWDGTAWVDETTAQISENVRFRCEMHNNGTCCPLTDLVVTDTLSESLEYADNATVHFPDCTTVTMEPTFIVDGTYVWEFPDLVLLPCETLTIEFDAHVIGYGYDCNVQKATAICEETDVEVSDEDTACVDVQNGQDNEVYFVPEDSYGPYCEHISVLIMVDAVDLTTSAGMDIYFDPNCVNITNVDFTGTPYSMLTDWTHGGNYVRIGVMAKDPIEPGTYLIANLTLHCEKETECTSNLAFDETELLDHDRDPLPNVIWHDGTFSCGVPPCIPGIEVNKTVWDKESQAWVEETTAEICENVRFRCEMHNNGTCCPLTNLEVTDILSDSLEYADNATVHFPDCTTVTMEPTFIVDGTYVWEFPDLVLLPCETLTIEFDAHVIKCGVDENLQTATAICVETEEEVFDDDTATVVVPPKPGIEVNKTVWDQEREAWVEETTAQICENVRFRCEMHNNGTCCPLTNLVVTDTLSDSLEYADNATVHFPNCTTERIEPTFIVDGTYVWEFSNLVLLPCETLTIEFDAHVVKCGVDVNTQTVTAICVETEEEVSDEDTATVVVPPKPGIEVNKTVWDGTAWVDERTAEISENVRFRCEMHNNGTCCPLTNLVVTDTLSDSLEYADNATVHFPNCTTVTMEPTIVDSTYVWEFPNLVLLPCETLTIEFDAHVIDYGYDCNVQKATAICEETGVEVSDEDTACVDVPELPDLTVTEITVNYDAPDLGGRAVGPVPGDDVYTECNNLSAVIEEENGVDVESPFDVSFEIGGDRIKCSPVRVPGLKGGANKTVYCNCSWYPYAGDDFAINVTVDSNHEIPETNETNNTEWNNGTVVSNGYKGNGWQGPDKNLINEQCHDLDTINLIYAVGDSEYVSGSTHWTEYTANWTTDDFPIPDGASIEKALLYVYYTWDKNDVMPDNVTLKFYDNDIPLARHYSDRKGFGSYNYPSGMLVYDLLNKFAATGPKCPHAILTKATAADEVSMRGMLLVVVYKHPDEPERMIWIDEGYDMLYAKDSYAVTSEEATTYAPFTRCEQVPVEEIGKATLIAVAPSASDGDDMNRLSFNDGLWPGAWSGFAGATQLGIAEANVLAYLKPADNRANFQSHIPAGGDKGDFMDASNAFLILEKEVPCPAKYAVYQAKVSDPEEPLDKLRALRDQKLEDSYVTRYYEHSPMLTLVLSRADLDLVKDGAQLVSRYSIPVDKHVQGMDVDKRITKQDVEEALSFTERLKREVMKNRDAIGVKSTEAIIVFIDEFEGQVKASEGKTFSAALKSSIYYEGGQLRVDQEIEKE